METQFLANLLYYINTLPPVTQYIRVNKKTYDLILESIEKSTDNDYDTLNSAVGRFGELKLVIDEDVEDLKFEIS